MIAKNSKNTQYLENLKIFYTLAENQNYAEKRTP